MTVIFLCPSLSPTGGWNRYSYDVITRVARFADVVVLCHEKAEGVDPAIRQLPILRQPLAYLVHPLWTLLDAWRVRSAIKRLLPAGGENVIHSTVEAYGTFAPFLRGLGARLLMTTHGTYSVLPLRSRAMRGTYRRMYRALDRVISVSEYTKRHLLLHAGDVLDASRIQVVLNGVDYREKPTRSRTNDGIFRILTAGEVKHRKGGHHLVRVALELKRRHAFPFRVTFVGNVQKEKPYYRALEAFLREHDLLEDVVFTGMVSQEELDARYAESDLFALLSVHEHGHYEGYPLVFHEAAMWGLPAIGSFDCGAEDAIRNGETGVLVHPSRHEEIADIIAAIRSGETPISSEACKAWARANDWGRKDLMAMYRF